MKKFIYITLPLSFLTFFIIRTFGSGNYLVSEKSYLEVLIRTHRLPLTIIITILFSTLIGFRYWYLSILDEDDKANIASFIRLEKKLFHLLIIGCLVVGFEYMTRLAWFNDYVYLSIKNLLDYYAPLVMFQPITWLLMLLVFILMVIVYKLLNYALITYITHQNYLFMKFYIRTKSIICLLLPSGKNNRLFYIRSLFMFAVKENNNKAILRYAKILLIKENYNTVEFMSPSWQNIFIIETSLLTFDIDVKSRLQDDLSQSYQRTLTDINDHSYFNELEKLKHSMCLAEATPYISASFVIRKFLLHDVAERDSYCAAFISRILDINDAMLISPPKNPLEDVVQFLINKLNNKITKRIEVQNVS